MRYRGKVSNGVVVLEGESLPEGMVVEVTPAAPVGSIATDPAIGMWKDRTDLPTDGAEAARVLRRRLTRRFDDSSPTAKHD